MKYLLDTNVISELISKQPDPQVIDWIDQCDPASIYISVITIGEICKGIAKLAPSPRRDNLRNWLEHDLLLRFQGKITQIDTAVMVTWGELVGRLELAGTPMPAVDSLIAALALHHDCILVTRNGADFQHAGIMLFNPWVRES